MANNEYSDADDVVSWKQELDVQSIMKRMTTKRSRQCSVISVDEHESSSTESVHRIVSKKPKKEPEENLSAERAPLASKVWKNDLARQQLSWTDRNNAHQSIPTVYKPGVQEAPYGQGHAGYGNFRGRHELPIGRRSPYHAGSAVPTQGFDYRADSCVNSPMSRSFDSVPSSDGGFGSHQPQIAQRHVVDIPGHDIWTS